MASGGKVNLRVDHVLLKVKNRSDEFLDGVALQVEAQTKVNIQRNGQIDTGFMLNSTYMVSRRSNTYSQALPTGTYPGRKSNASANRTLAPQQGLPGKASAACVVGANYAIYQEERKAFLYPAAQTVAGQIGGSVEKKFKAGLHD